MSFGGSPPDLLTLAKVAYDIYQFHRNAPEDLQDLLEKFEIVAKKSERLSMIVEKSGRGYWDDAPKLMKYLLECKEYLEQFHPIADRVASPELRARKKFRLTVESDKVHRIKERLSMYEQQMTSFESDLVLACTLTNLRRANIPTAPEWHAQVQNITGSGSRRAQSSLGSGHRGEWGNNTVASSQVISESLRAVKMAKKLRREPQSMRMIMESPPLAAEPSNQDREAINQFLTDVVSLAEESELYIENADPIQNLDTLAKITEKATGLRTVLRPSKDGMSDEAMRYHLPAIGEHSPESLGEEMSRVISLNTDSTSVRQWVSEESQRSRPGKATSSYPMRGNLPPTPSISSSENTRSLKWQLSLQPANEEADEDVTHELDDSSESDIGLGPDVGPAAKEHLDLPGRVQIDLRPIEQRPITCELDLEVSDGSIRIWAVATTQKRQSSINQTLSPPLRLTPSSLLSGVSSSESFEITVQPRTFQHCFEPLSRPIPHILHPDYEGPEEEPAAPYKISFKDPQYIVEERDPEGARQSTLLTYIFTSKEARDTVSEKIFGKTLLVTSGTNRISYKGDLYCHMGAISMWKDESTGVKSITFFRDLTSSKKHSSRDFEFEILGIDDAKQAVKSETMLALMVKPVEGSVPSPPLSPSSTFSRRSGLHAVSTTETQSSTKIKGKKRSDHGKCTIEFTNAVYKRSFMQFINPNP